MTEQTIPGPAWIPSFLEALTRTGQAKAAMAVAGIGSGAVYGQRKTNHAFAEAWRAALPPKPVRSAAARAKAGQTRSGGWRTRFLEALAETSNVTVSALRANVPMATVYRVKRCDAAFAAAWLEALNEGYDQLEMELLGYLRDPQPQRKMDVAAALRLLAAHRETVERRRALTEEEDEQASVESLDRFIEDMRQRRFANAAILIEAEAIETGARDVEADHGAG